MIIELDKLEHSSNELSVVIDAAECDLESDSARAIGDIHLIGNIKREAPLVFLSGKVNGSIEIDCSRCLEPVEQALMLGFRAGYKFGSVENVSGSVELENSDLDIETLENPYIDVAAAVREQILLSLPEQFFCNENCKGLCQKCGENLNLVNCDCADGEIDPRWAALKELS